jgi:hypothetical protein
MYFLFWTLLPSWNYLFVVLDGRAQKPFATRDGIICTLGRGNHSKP